ncbi:unnamed protein product [Cuscuta epithymum]|uniref:Uncharacterized protein n=1 Tax=Cuscuta epithymum TaxID=186058 RepID=A0AAV0EPA8_9ASTE|nr:unnamed protein product [Cuscuta epithymum]
MAGINMLPLATSCILLLAFLISDVSEGRATPSLTRLSADDRRLSSSSSNYAVFNSNPSPGAGHHDTPGGSTPPAAASADGLPSSSSMYTVFNSNPSPGAGHHDTPGDSTPPAASVPAIN